MLPELPGNTAGSQILWPLLRGPSQVTSQLGQRSAGWGRIRAVKAGGTERDQPAVLAGGQERQGNLTLGRWEAVSGRGVSSSAFPGAPQALQELPTPTGCSLLEEGEKSKLGLFGTRLRTHEKTRTSLISFSNSQSSLNSRLPESQEETGRRLSPCCPLSSGLRQTPALRSRGSEAAPKGVSCPETSPKWASNQGVNCPSLWLCRTPPHSPTEGGSGRESGLV